MCIYVFVYGEFKRPARVCDGTQNGEILLSAAFSQGGGSEDPRRQLIEARRLLNKLQTNCRQTIAFLDGVSALDNKRLKRNLQDALRDVERFMKV